MKAFLLLITLIVLFALVSWVLLTYVLVSDETRIRWTIEKGRKAVQSGSILTFSTLLTDEYQDSSGLDRGMMVSALQTLFQETSNRKVFITRQSITIQGRRAEAEIGFVFQCDGERNRTRNWAMSTNAGDSRIVKIVFLKEEHRWLISRTIHD